MGLLLSPDHGATLTDPLTWTDNPFVVRDTRRDIKRRQPFVSFCWMCGVLLVVAPWAAGTLWSVQTAATMLPPMFGVSHGSGDIGTILFFLIAGVHIWFIIGAAQRHTIRQFTDESNQNTLSSLLMLPASPFQVLVQSMVYPWMVAMRLAVALLPVYVFCVAIDGPSWLDLVMLYVVFALAALSVPFWNRPALSENVAILTAPKQTGAGARQTAVGRDAAAARSMSISGALALRLALIPVALIWIITVSTGGLSNGLEWLQQYLPTSVVALIEPIVVSWPLLIARLLVSPLDWFGTPLIPLPFVLVLFLVERYLRLVRASELLSVGAYRDLPLQATYLSRRRLEAWYRGALALVVTGYLWKPLVAQGALAWLAPRTAGTPQGLPGFLFLLIFVAGLWAMGRGAALGQWQHAPFIRGERAILCRNSILDGARYLAAPFGCTLAFYLLCCLLARAEPFPGLQNSLAGGSAAMALQMTLIAMAGALFSFGVSRLVGGGGLLLRLIPLPIVGLAVYYGSNGPFRYSLQSVAQLAPIVAILPKLQRLEILSPALGMLHAAADRGGPAQRLLPAAPPWYAWVLVAALLGGVLWAAAHLLDRRHAAAREDAVTLVFNPTIVGREAFSDPVQMKRAGIGLNDTPFVLGVIAAVQRVWDNAVLARELRSRLRGKWDRGTLVAVLIVATILSTIWFAPQIQSWPATFGLWAAYPLFDAARTQLAATAGGILGCWYIVLYIVALGNAFVTTGAFFAETQKSTLGFTLSTPMSTRAIVFGKAAGLLGPSLGVMAGIAAWTLMLSILFLPMVGPAALAAWAFSVVNALTFYLLINGVTFAISAMFPKLSMSGAAWIWLLLIWFGSGPMIAAYVLISIVLMNLGLRGFSFWLTFVAGGWGLIVLAFTIAESSIHSMRRRDLSFASSMRNN